MSTRTHTGTHLHMHASTHIVYIDPLPEVGVAGAARVHKLVAELEHDLHACKRECVVSAA